MLFISDKPNISIFTIPKYRSYEPSQMFHVAVTRTVEKKRQRQCFNIVPRELCLFSVSPIAKIRKYLSQVLFSSIDTRTFY